MKTNWIVEFLNENDFEFQGLIGDNEVWRNNKQIFIIHPNTGIKLIYHLDMFDEHYTEDVIVGDIRNYDARQGSKL
jgi:hypothetical protein